jgi:K+-sensing histidine kinase KdpD
MISMKKLHFSSKQISQSLLAVLVILATTAVMLLIGRNTLGEAVVALLYLVPIAWSANRWGQQAGITAALVAALMFDFFFIPPFYTFRVGQLEGWLVLAIFLTVAIVVVGRIQASLSTARETVMMYDLSAALTGLRTQDAVAHVAAKHLQKVFLASQVRIIYRPQKDAQDIVVSEPKHAEMANKPDRQLPLLNSWGLIGEIQIFGSEDIPLPADDSRILKNFAMQIANAFERTQVSV